MRTILKVINWNLCYFHWFKVGRLNVFLTSWTRKLISLLFLLVSGYGKCSSVGSSSSCSCSGTNPRLQRTVGRLLSFDWQDWRSGSHRSPGQVEAGKKILYLFFVPFSHHPLYEFGIHEWLSQNDHAVIQVFVFWMGNAVVSLVCRFVWPITL